MPDPREHHAAGPRRAPKPAPSQHHRLSTRAAAGPSSVSASPRQHGMHSFAPLAAAVLDHLRAAHVAVLPGLTELELARAEAELGFAFPPDLRAVLAAGVPSGPGFPDWCSRSGLRSALDLPIAAASLSVDEFLPLLDILASRVRAVRRLRELLTPKFPPGTFPVKVVLWQLILYGQQ